MSIAATHQLRALNLAVEQLVELTGADAPGMISESSRHLGLVIIEAILDEPSHLDPGASRLIRRYADAVPGLHEWEQGASPPHGAFAMLNFLKSLSTVDRHQLLGWHQMPETGEHRVNSVLRVAETLLSYGVDDCTDLAHWIGRLPNLERDVRCLPGLTNEMWEKLLNRSTGGQVKADSAVVSWVRTILFDQSVDDAEVADLLEAITRDLQRRGSSVTVHTVDQLIRRDACELGES